MSGSKPHSSLDEAKRQAIRILAGGPVLYPEEYALVAREFLGLLEQLEAAQALVAMARDPERWDEFLEASSPATTPLPKQLSA